MPDATQSLVVHRFGVFELNPRLGELRKNGMRLRLSGQPLQVLSVLIERAGEVVTREELRAKLWPADTFVDFDHGLNNAVARIREVLGDSSETPRYVETVPRRGYRFIAPLTEVAPAKDASAPESISASAVISEPTFDPSVPLATKRPASGRLWLVFAGAAALAVLAAGFLLYARKRATNKPQRPINSVAVLPLKNLSGDPAQEYLADGMTEELIGRLSMIHGLRVTSRTSVMALKDKSMAMPEIAKTLGADALVEGSVIRNGSRIRVHAQLIRGTTDEHFWTATYDREFQGALALESEVAQAIAQRVEITLTGEEHARLVASRYVAPEVYENYLKGYSAKGSDRASLQECVSHFEEALKKDATFAPAYVGLGAAHFDLSSIFIGAPVEAERQKALRAVQKALELDPSLADAHVLLAEIKQREWQWTEAKVGYERALNLKPNDANAHMGLADWLMCHGRMDEALDRARYARELDPLGTSGAGIGFILFQARRYDEALRELRSQLEVRPDDAWASWLVGFVLIGKGLPEEAIPALEKTAKIMHRSPGSIELLATANARAGHRTQALRLINELKRRRETTYVPPGAFINPYLALGEYDEAFVWFERAYQEKSAILQFVKVHPFFDPVRNDPRFKDLVQRVGLD